MENQAVVSMDIGGTNVRMALVTRGGEVVARSQSPCRIHEGQAAFLDSLKDEYGKACAYAQMSQLEIMAVGAGVPGIIDRNGTIISSVNLKPLDGFNLHQWLHSLVGLPAVVMNDANAAAVAEKSYGSGQPFSSLLHLTLGTGVGSGLILNGRLWTGFDGVASEFGHMTVEPDGYLCQCGNHGCLEQYASSTAILRFAKEKISGGAKSTLCGIQLNTLETADVAAAAYNGDLLALECFGLAGRYLGIACATAVNLLNLEAIILGGGVSASFALIAPAIRAEIDARAFHLPAARVKLLQGQLDDNAGIIGAAAAAFAALSSA